MKKGNNARFKQPKSSIEPPKVLPTYNLALGKLEKDPKRMEPGPLSERQNIKERHFKMQSPSEIV